MARKGLRTDYQASEDDNVTIQAVEGSKGSMGYFGYSYFAENPETLKALEIDGGSGCVAPSPETAQDGSYTPLGRQLYIYPSAEALERPEVEAFVRFYIENIDEIVEAAGFIGLNDEQKTALTGTVRHAHRRLSRSVSADESTGAGVSLRRSQPRLGERAIEAVLFLAALVSVLTTIGIVIAIIGPTIDFFREPAVTVWGLPTGTEWTVLFKNPSRNSAYCRW